MAKPRIVEHNVVVRRKSALTVQCLTDAPEGALLQVTHVLIGKRELLKRGELWVDGAKTEALSLSDASLVDLLAQLPAERTEINLWHPTRNDPYNDQV